MLSSPLCSMHQTVNGLLAVREDILRNALLLMRIWMLCWTVQMVRSDACGLPHITHAGWILLSLLWRSKPGRSSEEAQVIKSITGQLWLRSFYLRHTRQSFHSIAWTETFFYFIFSGCYFGMPISQEGFPFISVKAQMCCDSSSLRLRDQRIAVGALKSMATTAHASY